MVPGQVATVLDRPPHCSKRNGASGNSIGNLGGQWKSSTELAMSDNMAVVCALSSGTARDPLLMHLLRCLHFFSAHFQISIVVRRVAGVENAAADALSRNNPDIFLSCTLQAAGKASQVLSPLLDMLLHNQPCCYTINQIGPQPAGGVCFLVPWKSSSTGHRTCV